MAEMAAFAMAVCREVRNSTPIDETVLRTEFLDKNARRSAASMRPTVLTVGHVILKCMKHL